MSMEKQFQYNMVNTSPHDTFPAQSLLFSLNDLLVPQKHFVTVRAFAHVLPAI